MADVVYDAILGTGPTYLRQVVSSEFNENIDLLEGRESGNPYKADQFIQSAHPEAQFSTMDIGNFLSIFGIEGSLLDGLDVAVPYNKRANGGTFGGDGTNFKVSGVETHPVLLIPQSITFPRLGPVVAQGVAHFLSVDGVTKPYAIAVNQDLDAQAFVAMYGMGPCYVNSTRIDSLVGVTINFGIELSEKQHFEGSPYPTKMFIEQINPSIEFMVEDFDQVATFEAVNVTQLSAYIRKRTSGGTYVANNTAGHCKIGLTTAGGSTAKGMAVAQAVRASDTKHGNAALRITGCRLTSSSASAITSP